MPKLLLIIELMKTVPKFIDWVRGKDQKEECDKEKELRKQDAKEDSKNWTAPEWREENDNGRTGSKNTD